MKQYNTIFDVSIRRFDEIAPSTSNWPIYAKRLLKANNLQGPWSYFSFSLSSLSLKLGSFFPFVKKEGKKRKKELVLDTIEGRWKRKKWDRNINAFHWPSSLKLASFFVKISSFLPVWTKSSVFSYTDL